MTDVSIIIPVYNTAQYLASCFESILAQTHRNFEVIVIDDGSSDGSGAICDEYQEKDSRFIVRHKKNGGVCSARNLGLSLVSGKYFCFVDSDDTLLPDHVEVLFQNAEDHCCVVSSARFASTQNKARSVDSIRLLNRDDAKLSVTDYRHGLRGFAFCKLYRTDIMRDNNLNFRTEFTLSEDVIFVTEYLNLCEKNDVVCLSSKVIYNYNTSRNDSALGQRTTAKEYKESWQDSVRAIDYLLNETERFYQEGKIDQKQYKRTKNQWMCVKVAQSVSQIRIMAHYHRTKDVFYKECRRYIVKHLFRYFGNRNYNLKQKAGAILVLVYPYV